MYSHPIPTRVRVLILGGGIHGVGVLHDLVSRGWNDVHLIEKSTLASGTSSKSTKLIHGGLRYLQRFSQMGMVSDSLRERRFLLDVAHDIVKPIELVIPVEKSRFGYWLKMKFGLSMYDVLAGKERIRAYSDISRADFLDKCPIINDAMFSTFLSFWDAQTDDVALVRRVAASAVKLGGGISENTKVNKIYQDDDGWRIETQDQQGQVKVSQALYVINCLGPWSNQFLEQNHLSAPYPGMNVKGTHILTKDFGLKSGLFLKAKSDGRLFFMLPWCGYTLIGTTEALYEGHPDQLRVEASEVEYLLKSCNEYLRTALKESDILSSFSGLRWLAYEKNKSLSSISRETLIGENESKRGLMLTIYGGKLTSYRSLSAKVGDRITQHFGEFRETATLKRENWVSADEYDTHPFQLARFS